MRICTLKRLVLAVVAAMVGIGAYAQADVESPYSMFGVGQLANKSMNVRLKGMGGLENGMYGPGLINSANPASYARIDSLAFLFDAGFYCKTSNFSTSTHAEQAANASFDHLYMAFGLTDWWKMALGVQPYSTMGYTMLVDSNDPDVGNYTTAFNGTGGLNQAVIGTAFKIGKHFSLGANAKYVYGDSKMQTTLYFPDSIYIIGSRISEDLMVSSFKFDYGLMYCTELGNDYNLSVGITYDQPIGLRGKKTTYIRTIAADSYDDIEYLIDTAFYEVNDKSKLSMPQGFGAGFTLQKNNRWCLGVDFDWTQWSRFARDGINDSLSDSWRITAGFEYIPTHTSISNYFRRITYRVGGFYESSYITLRGHDLGKMGVSVGASLPLPRTLSKINLALEVGRFGTKMDGLIQENYLKFDVSVSVFERWFIKRKYK